LKRRCTDEKLVVPARFVVAVGVCGFGIVVLAFRAVFRALGLL